MNTELKEILRTLWNEAQDIKNPKDFDDWIATNEYEDVVERHIKMALNSMEGREDYTFRGIADEIVELQARKNVDYGNAFDKSYREFGLVSPVVRLTDKLNRLKSLIQHPALVNESLEDTLKDMAAYAIMTIQSIRNEARESVNKG